VRERGEEGARGEGGMGKKGVNKDDTRGEGGGGSRSGVGRGRLMQNVGGGNGGVLIVFPTAGDLLVCSGKTLVEPCYRLIRALMEP
jgi:hypothetical protein